MPDEWVITLPDGRRVALRKRDVGPGPEPAVDPRPFRVRYRDRASVWTRLGFRSSRFPTGCSHCAGSGTVHRVVNPDWPAGDGPHMEAVHCPRCDGTGRREVP